MEALKKNAPAFSKIQNNYSPAVGKIPIEARIAWKLVHTAEQAKAWHLKWTPWFTEEQIDAFIKYAYPEQLKKIDEEIKKENNI